MSANHYQSGDGIAQLLHNPRCSKSRAALDWLKANKIEFDVIEYLREPLNKNALKSLSRKINLPVKSMIRPTEPQAKSVDLKPGSLHEDEWVYDYIVQYPNLLERPIVIWKNKAAIGRPLDNIIALFQKEVAHVA